VIEDLQSKLYHEDGWIVLTRKGGVPLNNSFYPTRDEARAFSQKGGHIVRARRITAWKEPK
jgi:hypothetical protein